MARAPKQEHKTPEEVARTLEVKRKGLIVKEQFYPSLVGATVSIDEAKMLIGSISTLMMEEVLQTMKERKFSDISGKLLKKLCPDGAREKEIAHLLSIFDNEDLFVTREIVEGMRNVIEQMLMDENKARTLNSLTPDWDKMLNR